MPELLTATATTGSPSWHVQQVFADHRQASRPRPCAPAKRIDSHILTLQLPNGVVEQTHNTGGMPPHVILTHGEMPLVMSFAADDPFARMERIWAAVDRQTAAMLQAIDRMAAQRPPAR